MKSDIDALTRFLDASPSQYHATAELSRMLTESGATELLERETWELVPATLYFVRRSDSSLVAFRTGKDRPSRTGFRIAGAHTDSPTLKLKSFLSRDEGAQGKLALELYGSPIVSTWMDKPLSVAGKIMVKTGGGLKSRLVNLKRPIAVIPNLAIHMNRDMNKGVEINAQTQLKPLAFSRSSENFAEWALLDEIAAQTNTQRGDILAGDLCLYDPSGAVTFGYKNEFLNAPRLDNLQSCFAILASLLVASPSEATQVGVFFDHEEIGSSTAEGADSMFLRDILSRIAIAFDAERDARYCAYALSCLLSIDSAQAFNPGYPDKFDPSHVPVLNGGVAVKKNANRRYATDVEGEAVFRCLCSEEGLPCQDYMSRSDLSPGSTVGPVSSAVTGIRTIDIGLPLLAMHSSRETAGCQDHAALETVLARFYSVHSLYR